MRSVDLLVSFSIVRCREVIWSPKSISLRLVRIGSPLERESRLPDWSAKVYDSLSFERSREETRKLI